MKYYSFGNYYYLLLLLGILYFVIFRYLPMAGQTMLQHIPGFRSEKRRKFLMKR